MKIYVVLVAMILALFLIGCTGEFPDVDLSKVDVDQIIKCDAPYIRHGTDCCLDQNTNKICDNDESANQQVHDVPQSNIPGDQQNNDPQCADQCTSSNCKGKEYFGCKKSDVGCNHEYYIGMTIGECGVECFGNSDCDSDQICVSNLCVQKVSDSQPQISCKMKDFFYLTSNYKTYRATELYNIDNSKTLYPVMMVDIENKEDQEGEFTVIFHRTLKGQKKAFEIKHILAPGEKKAFELIFTHHGSKDYDFDGYEVIPPQKEYCIDLIPKNGCKDQCESSKCDGMKYISCHTSNSGCKYTINENHLVGKCGVECNHDSECNSDETCVQHKCVETESYCGDGDCNTPYEDCASCVEDCGCDEGGFCRHNGGAAAELFENVCIYNLDSPNIELFVGNEQGQELEPVIKGTEGEIAWFYLWLDNPGKATVNCDIEEFYNGDLNEEFSTTVYSDSITEDMKSIKIGIEPQDSDAINVKYEFACYNLGERGQRDQEFEKSILVYFEESENVDVVLENIHTHQQGEKGVQGNFIDMSIYVDGDLNNFCPEVNSCEFGLHNIEKDTTLGLAVDIFADSGKDPYYYCNEGDCIEDKFPGTYTYILVFNKGDKTYASEEVVFTFN
jgi:hypothetical protein